MREVPSVVGPAVIKIHDLNQPADRRELEEVVLRKALELVTSRLGKGFTLHPFSDMNMARGSWRAIKIDAKQLDRLDEGLLKLAEDIVKTGVRHFMDMGTLLHRAPGGVVGNSGGISLRVALNYVPYPKPAYNLDIDWIAWI